MATLPGSKCRQQTYRALPATQSQTASRCISPFARIEISPGEFPKLIEKENREKIYAEFKSYGFTYVTMDLMGYRTGSMNESLTGAEREAAADGTIGK